MNTNTCNNCGTVYRYQNGQRRCLVCGAVIAENVSEKEQKKLSEAFALLGNAQFDEARAAFEAILQKYPMNADAYWGRLRARYHISYVMGVNEKLAPKCPTRSGAGISEDVDYRKALECADEEQRDFLQEQAERIRIACTDSGASKNRVDRFTFGEIDPNDAFVMPPKKNKKPIILSAVLSVFLIVAAIAFVPGLFMTRTNSGLSFTFYEGTCTVGGGNSEALEIVIPAMKRDTPVSAIANNAFYGYANVTTVEIPESVTRIGDNAFRDCINLKNIHFNGTVAQWNAISFGSYWNASTDAYTVTCIDGTVAKEVVSEGLSFAINDNGSYTLTGIGTCTDTDIVIPRTYLGVPVTAIGSGAFHSNETLTSVLIPDGVQTIGSSAFYGCKNLKSVTVPDTVTEIENFAFRNCSALEGIVIPEGVTAIGLDTFWGCSALTSIVIPQSVTRIGDTAFRYCRALNTVQFNGTDEQWSAISFGSDWNATTGEYVIVCTNGTVAKDGAVIS